MRYPLFIGLFFIIFHAHSQKLKVYNNYEAARKKASKENKILAVDFYTDWCGWCKVLDKETYTDPAVIDKLNKNFVLAKLNAEKSNSGYELAMRHAVTGFPHIYYFDQQNRLIHITGGFMYPQDYVGELDSILSLKYKGFYFPGVSEKNDLNFPDFYVKSFRKDKEYPQRPDSIELLTYLNTHSVYSEETFLVYCKNNHYMKPDYRFFDAADSLIRIYPFVNVEGVIYSFLSNFIYHQPEVPMDSIKTLIQRYAPGDDKYKESMVKDISMLYFEERKDWKSYAITFDDYTRKNSLVMHNDSYNERAWTIYENSTDSLALRLALAWMEHVMLSSTDYNHWDTYAALLLANGHYAKAEEWAVKAIDLGRSEGKNVTATETLLQKIRSK